MVRGCLWEGLNGQEEVADKMPKWAAAEDAHPFSHNTHLYVTADLSGGFLVNSSLILACQQH